MTQPDNESFWNASQRCSPDEAAMPTTKEETRSLTLIAFGTAFTSSAAAIAITGNAAVITATLKFETIRKQTNNFLIFCLALTDAATAVTVMIPVAVSISLDYWPFGVALCHYNACLRYCFACASSNNLAVISLDRVVAISCPFSYPRVMTLQVLKLICGVLMMESFILGLLVGIPDWVEWNYWEAVCTLSLRNTDSGAHKVYSAGFLLCFVIPAIFIVICNVVIILSARKARPTVIPLDVDQKVVAHVPRFKNNIWKNKAVRSMVVLIATYYLCFSPHAIAKVLDVNYPNVIPRWLQFCSTLFAFVSSAANPFIYAIFRRDYRKYFRSLFYKSMRWMSEGVQ